jgi:hypothetical protein
MNGEVSDAVQRAVAICTAWEIVLAVLRGWIYVTNKQPHIIVHSER